MAHMPAELGHLTQLAEMAARIEALEAEVAALRRSNALFQQAADSARENAHHLVAARMHASSVVAG